MASGFHEWGGVSGGESEMKVIICRGMWLAQGEKQGGR